MTTSEKRLEATRQLFRRHPGYNTVYKHGLDWKSIPPIPAVCDFCHLPFEAMKARSPVLDHNHLTNTFRGWVHDYCNRTLIGANTLETIVQVREYLLTRGG